MIPATSPLAAAMTVAGLLGVAKQSWFGDFVYIQRDGSANGAALYRASRRARQPGAPAPRGHQQRLDHPDLRRHRRGHRGECRGLEQGGLILCARSGQSDAVERVRVGAAGNVGIGGTSGGDKFDTFGSVKVRGVLAGVLPEAVDGYIGMTVSVTAAVAFGYNGALTPNGFGAPANTTYFSGSNGWPLAITVNAV